MKRDRWVRRIYDFERAQLDRDPNTQNWCNLTKDWMYAVGLGECWVMQRPVKPTEAQRVPGVVTVRSIISGEEETTVHPHLTPWQVVTRKAVHKYEQWVWQVMMEDKRKLVMYRQWKKTLRRESYLKSKDVIGRSILFRLRS